MRLGILPSAAPAEEFGLSALAEALRARDVDVVLAQEPLQDAREVRREAERLQRADCDGVLVLATEGGIVAPPAALALTGTPLLLAGPLGPALLDTAGAWEEIGGIWYDRLPLLARALGEYLPQIEAWLRRNERRERQRGIEAARKLHGQRFAILGAAPSETPLDAAQWLSQFGVTVLRFEAGDAAASQSRLVDEEISFFCVTDADALETSNWDTTGLPFMDRGDANAALTLQLLRLISGRDDARVVEVAPTLLQPADRGETATFAAVARRAGRFVCYLLRGGLTADNRPFVDVSAERLTDALTAGRLCHVSGEHIGALRAACQALGIEARTLG